MTDLIMGCANRVQWSHDMSQFIASMISDPDHPIRRDGSYLSPSAITQILAHDIQYRLCRKI